MITIMKKLLPLFLLAQFVSISCFAEKDKWSLVWSDEFNYEGLPDPTKWTYETGFVRNMEAQYYTTYKKNAFVRNGVLELTAVKEKTKNSNFTPKATKEDWKHAQAYADYSSAAITTQNKASWRYVKVEVSAKLSTGRGTWPAIWMLGDNIDTVGWPMCGEIDIMENVGFDPNVVHTNVHTQKYNHAIGTNKGQASPLKKPHESFNKYSVEWYPNYIDFFINDKKVFTFNNDGTGEEAWPFFKPQYLLLNLAVGGTWGGKEGIDEKVFPQTMYVDYVRVYENQRLDLKGTP